MCIFQSEPVIKLQFWPKITSLIFKSYTQVSVHWIIMCGMRCWDTARNSNQPTLLSWRLSCHWYGMMCHRRSLIMQSCHFERDFDHVLLQLVDTLNTQFKPRGQPAWHSSPKRFNCWRKSCAKFDSLLLNKTNSHCNHKKLHVWITIFQLLFHYCIGSKLDLIL